MMKLVLGIYPGDKDKNGRVVEFPFRNTPEEIEQILEAKADEILQLESTLKGCVMGWIVKCGPNLVIGQPPINQSQALFLCKTHKIDTVISLREKSPKKVRSEDAGTYILGKHVDGYHFWFRYMACAGIAKDNFHHLSIQKEMYDGSMKPEDIAAQYVSIAKHVVALAKDKCVYISHSQGNQHELFVALAAWKLMAKEKCPIDYKKETPRSWVKKHCYLHLLTNAEDCEMMNLVWTEVRKQTQGIHKYFKRM